jgi:hypothetical protein
VLKELIEKQSKPLPIREPIGFKTQTNTKVNIEMNKKKR